MKEDNHSQLSTLHYPLIPPGYKQTEVGVIPEDWKTDPLGDGINLISGHHVLARHCNTGGDGVPYITGPADFPNGVIQHTKFTTKPGIMCRANDVLVTVKGSGAGTLALADANYCISRQLMAIRVTEGSTNYIYFSLLRATALLGAAATGLIPGLSRSDILNKIIPLPPTKAEQEVIAEALNDTDALIESLEQLLTKKRHLKHGAMQELLTGKTRLPGFSAEWQPCQLRGCLLTNPDYGINAPGVPSSGELPIYLRITDIDDDGRFIANNRVAVNHPQSMGYILNENEIVFARTGASVGKTYLYDPADGVIVFAGFLIRAKIDRSKLCPKFFAAFTKTGRYWNWVRIMSMRSGQPGINGNEYASLDLNLPPLPEQSAIATILSDMDAEIAALEAKLTKTRQLKQGMMQELLTGKTRLVESGKLKVENGQKS